MNRRRVVPWIVGALLGMGAGASRADPVVVIEQATLVVPAGTEGDRLGESVAIDGDTAVVGAPSALASGSFPGAAHVFTRHGSAWALDATLVGPHVVAIGAAPPPTSARAFGSSVAIDGDTIVVGARSTAADGGDQTGGAYVFIRTGDSWSHQATLSASAPRKGDAFGYSVAVAGNTIVVGAPYSDAAGKDSGVATVFVRQGAAWTHQGDLITPGTVAGDLLGSSVALAGDTVVAGAPYTAGAAGAAAVFIRDGTAWSHQRTLIPPDGAAGDLFGASVSMSGDTVIAGAPYDDTSAGSDAGSAATFRRTGSVWAHTGTLTRPGAAGQDTFGFSVAVDGATAAAGAPLAAGAAEVFTGDAVGWTHRATLTGSGTPEDRLGTAVAVAGETVLVGIPSVQTGSYPSGSGSARVFTPGGGGWSLQAVLDVPDAGPGDLAGTSVDVDGDTAVVGAPGIVPGEGAGSATVFARQGSAWAFQAVLALTGGSPGDRSGWSVGVDGDTIAVGSPLDDTAAGENAGSAAVFARQGPAWAHQATLTAPDAGPGDLFGASVAVSGDTIVVGAPSDDTAAGEDAGRVVVFARQGGGWAHQATLASPGGAADDHLGSSVAIHGGTLVAGAPGDDLPAAEDAGSVVAWGRQGAAWGGPATITRPEPKAYDWLGFSVAVDGDTVVAGAPFADAPGERLAGVVALFTRQGAVWRHATTFTDPTVEYHGGFGWSVAVSGDTALAGAPEEEDGRGLVRVLRRQGSSWSHQATVQPGPFVAYDQFGSSLALDGRTILAGVPEDDTGAGENAGSAVVTLLDQVPVAAGDLYQLSEDSELTVAAAQGVMANDRDADGDPLTARPGAAHGEFDLHPDGSFSYRPEPNTTGDVVFTYRASDGYVDSAPAEATIRIAAVNDPPVAVEDAAATSVNQQVEVAVTGNDIDPDGDEASRLTVALEDRPEAGTATCSATLCTYTPTAGFKGSDTFSYRAADPTGARSEPATVSVEVVSAGVPVAAADTATTAEDTAVEVAVAGNDAPGDEPATVSLAIGPAQGSATCAGSTCTYRPAADHHGEERFTYTLTDADGQMATGSVAVSIIAVNDPPVATAPAPIVVDAGGTIPPLAATDADGDPLAFSVASGALPPGVMLNSDGTFTGTAGTPGVTTARIQACDPDRACSGVDLRVEVRAPAGGGLAGTETYPASLLPLPTDPAPPDDGATLPRTGGEDLAVGGILFTAAGLIILAAARRRRPPALARPAGKS